MQPRNLKRAALAAALAGLATASIAADLAPLPEPKFNKAQAELGKYFFFDERISGDAALSCATCHDPKKG